jgi:hypothetical protein
MADFPHGGPESPAFPTPENENELKGALFVNRYKTTENQPDYTGKCVIDGEEYRLAGWLRKARSSGNQFISLALTPQSQVDAHRRSRDEEERQKALEDTQDDIPF